MKKEYIKPTSEAVNFFPESALMGTSNTMGINSDEGEAIDDINQMKSNKQGFGKGLWD